MSEAIAQRAFTWEDQRLFAALTGDVNPMHMDALAARRTQAGAPVVHGMNVALWALDALCGHLPRGAAIGTVQCKFLKFVFVGESVSLTITRMAETGLKASVNVDGAAVSGLTVQFRPGSAADAAEIAAAPDIAVGARPDAWSADALQGRSGWIVPQPGADLRMASLYPALAAAISPPTVLSVALMSTLVGMVAPGLHSIFAETSFHIGGNDLTRDGLGFRVGAIDQRFQLVPITVAGPRLTGTVSAFLRAEPVAPPTAADAAMRVEPEGFAGQVALVAGGSRGLGAVSAMLLAAGGASVAVTYRQGREEADRLVADINARAPRAKAMALDVLQDPGPQLADAGPFTHLYYFATPKVFRQSSEIFSAEVFDEFAAVYLKGFARVFAHVHRSGRSLSVLYPSSVAVETRPKGMTEYAMVKAAGEELCKDLGRQWPSVRFLAPRLPRILTDQTATVPPVPAENATDVMLPLLRQCA